MDKKFTDYLEKIDSVIAKGPYKDDWASLAGHETPQWYKDAKFGIFIHWGVYSVPAFGSEWYPRNMYIKGTPEFEHHLKTYGPQKEFGYKDFIPMFRAEKFDAEKWMSLFEQAGAKYVMPVAEHHDGFQMYRSDLSDWCAAKMGPKRDVLGELGAAADKKGIRLCVSSHRAENFWFFGGAGTFDSGIRPNTFNEPYGFVSDKFATRDAVEKSSDITYGSPCKEHLDMWLARCCEVVDKYRPSIFYFDWWIQNEAFKPYLKKFAAYYYDRAEEWGRGVAINYKFDAFACGTAVFDIERGQLAGTRPLYWQTDTAIAKNSWGYTENNDFKKPEDIVCDLIDIVSKNGAMLLNVGPRSDGTITDEDTAVLLGIGRWLRENGESVYSTTFWKTFGEGPTEVREGSFTDTLRRAFTSEDIRYTYRAPYVYANVLSWPEDGAVSLRSFRSDKSGVFFGTVKKVELLGHPEAKITFGRDSEKMTVKTDLHIKTSYPVCLKITVD
jgi:alpha-L-fucosidase